MTNRRQFITTSTTAAAAALGGVHLHAESQSDRVVNFALVGLGQLSTHQLAPAFEKTKHAKLKGIVTGSPDKAAKWKSQYNLDDAHIYNYETYDQIADDDAIDVVYIVLPNGMHAEYTVRGAAAGKHVFCEKPMANTAAECQQMIDACQTADRHLGIAYRCQFEPHHQRCMELARDKTFGDTKLIQARFGFRLGDIKQWRLQKDLAGGGALMDVGIYALQACRYLSGGEPSVITAIETKTNPKKFAEVDETIAWSMEIPKSDGSGIIACDCATTYNFNGMNQFRVHGSDGWFGLDPAYNYTNIRGETSNDIQIEFDPIDQFAAEMDAFAKVILDGEPNRVPGEEGLRDVQIIQAIYQAAETGKSVTMA